MKVAAIQSSYIPWKGYFDIINDVDLFIFLDDVQMTKRDWRTRNKIKTSHGLQWLTVPVKGGRHQLIYEVAIADGDWQSSHRKTIHLNYAKTPYLHEFDWLLDWLYGQAHKNLSHLNRQATQMICEYLQIQTEFVCSTELEAIGSKDDRLIDLCQKVGATHYLSGPSAKDYINAQKFADTGIELSYKSYSEYPEYAQVHPPFEHGVSILDLLFHCGPASPEFIWG